MQPVEGASAPGPTPSPARLALALGLGCVVNPLNATMIAVAFPDIAESFGVGLTDASWLVTLYLALTACMQPISGSIGDRFGRRRVYLVGLVLFGIASALAALAPTLTLLIAFRCAQAVSSALVIPNGLAILRDGVPEGRRGQAVGLLGAMMGTGAAIGLPLGAVLVERAGWSAIFWVNLPIVLLGLHVARRTIPAAGPTRPDVSPVAVLGAALLPLAIGLEMSHRPEMARAGAGVLALAALAVAAGAFTVWRSKAARADFLLLATRPVLGALVFIAFQQFVFFTVLLVLPTWLTTALELPHGRSGMYLGVMTLLVVLLAPVAGRLSDRHGARLPTVTGAVIVTCGLAVLAISLLELTTARALAGLLLLGVGFGAAGPAVQRAALEEAPAPAVGLAMGLFTSARYLGGIVGAALLSASFAERSVSVSVAEGVTILRRVVLWGALPAIGAAALLRAKRRAA